VVPEQAAVQVVLAAALVEGNLTDLKETAPALPGP
jgi:hypothetical protein